MKTPILYSFKRCPYAMRARMALLLANIQCEIREVSLDNKPKHMLEISPKGTVPVLILEDQIIDESMNIVNWAITESKLIINNISRDQIEITESIINTFDNNFKYHLDRYKYSTRYKNINKEFHKFECLNIILDIEKIIGKERWFFGNELNKLDITILPFLRQFKIADPNWFESLTKIPKTQKLLNNFLDSRLFLDIMRKYDFWNELSNKQLLIKNN